MPGANTRIAATFSGVSTSPLSAFPADGAHSFSALFPWPFLDSANLYGARFSSVKGATPAGMNPSGGVGRVRRKQNRRSPCVFFRRPLTAEPPPSAWAPSRKSPQEERLILLLNQFNLSASVAFMKKIHYLYICIRGESSPVQASDFNKTYSGIIVSRKFNVNYCV